MTNVDVTKFSNIQLDTYIGNCQRQGRRDLARSAAIERIQRGRYNQQLLALIEWTPSQIEKLLSPFAELAGQVKNSKRKAYVEAGGRCRKSRHDPDALWIDQYCGVKASGVNATISCQIKEPGDTPVLMLIERTCEGPRELSYEPHDVGVAMDDWLSVIKRATGNRLDR